MITLITFYFHQVFYLKEQHKNANPQSKVCAPMMYQKITHYMTHQIFPGIFYPKGAFQALWFQIPKEQCQSQINTGYQWSACQPCWLDFCAKPPRLILNIFNCIRIFLENNQNLSVLHGFMWAKPLFFTRATWRPSTPATSNCICISGSKQKRWCGHSDPLSLYRSTIGIVNLWPDLGPKALDLDKNSKHKESHCTCVAHLGNTSLCKIQKATLNVLNSQHI